MAAIIEEAIYKMTPVGVEKMKEAAAAIDGVAVSEEKLTRATRTTEDGFERLIGKLDPAVRAHQQYQRTLEQVKRYEADGIGTATERARVIDIATRKYVDQVSALQRAAQAQDQFNKAQASAANSAQAINQRLGVQTEFGGAGRAQDIAAYGQELDKLRAKFSPLFAAGQQYKATLSEINMASRVGAITENERIAAIQRTKDAFANQVTALRAYGSAVDVAGRRNGAFGGSLTQLSFQINDIASGLAMGQSPFTIMAQQGGQVFQVWQMNRNIFNELKNAVTGFLTPGRLIVAGFAAAAGAAYLLYQRIAADSPTAEQHMEEHARLLGIITKAYGDATQKAGEFYQQSKNITQLQIQQNALALQNQLRSMSRGILNQTSIPTGSGLIDMPLPPGTPMAMEGGIMVEERFRGLQSAINNFNESVNAGTPDIIRYREEVAKIGLAAQGTNPVLAAQAAAILKSTQEAADLGLALQKLEAMLRMLGGTATDTDRKLLGMSVKTATQSVNAYDQLIQRTKDRIDELKLEADTAGLASDAVLKLRLQHQAERAAKQAGVSVNQEVLDQLKEELALRTRAVADAKLKSDIKFSRETAFLTPEDVQIAQQLRDKYKDVATALNSIEAAELRVLNMQTAMFDGARDFAKTFASGILDGRDAIESLTAALDNLAKKLLDAGINNLISGALSGNVVQAAIGAVEIASAFLVDWLSDTTKAQREAEKQLEEAKKRWSDMQDQYVEFMHTINGTQMGDLTRQLRQVTKDAFEMGRAAFEAKDWASLGRIIHDYIQFVNRTAEEFGRAFPVMIEALNAGQGFESPLLAGVQKTKQIADQLKGFLDDTQNMFAILGGWHLEGMMAVGTGDASSQVAMAQKAAQTFALSLLDTTQPLSDTAKSILEMRGVAMQLRVTLVELGMSAEEAAKAIETKMAAAMVNLRTKLTDDLQRQINEAAGQGFINQIADLIKQRDQMIADFTLAGADTSLIPRFFELTAQRIIDQADLTGEAFSGLVALFPELTGVVHESTKALEEQKQAEEERKRALDQTARGIVDYVNNLLTGSESTLSPIARKDAALSTYNAQLLLAQGGNAEAQASITKYFEDARQAMRDVYASSAPYQQFVQQGISQLLSLPAVVESEDPVVTAIRDSILEMQNITENTGQTVNRIEQLSGYVGTGDQSGLRLLVSQMSGYIGSGDTVGLRKLMSDVSSYIGSGDTSGLRKLVNDMAGYIGSGDTTGLRNLVSNVATYIGSGDSSGVRKLLSDVSSYIGSGDTAGLRRLMSDVSSNIGSGDTVGLRKLVSDVSSYIGTGDTAGLRKLVGDVSAYIGSSDSSGVRKLLSDVSSYIGSGDTIGLRNLVNNVATYIGNNDTSGMRKLIDDVGVYIGSGDTAGLRKLVNDLGTYIGVTDSAGLRKLTDEVGDYIGATESAALRSAIKSLVDAITDVNGTNYLLDHIDELQFVASRQLELLNSQLTSGTFTFSTTTGGGQTGTSNTFSDVNNNLLTALNKIVYNTHQTVKALKDWAANPGGYTWASMVLEAGTLAAGGWISGPGGPLDDRAGLYRLSNGEHVTNAISARYNAPILDAINAARGPIDIRPMLNLPSFQMAANDNYSREIVFELRRLYTRIEQLESRLVSAEMRGAQHVVGAVVESAEVIEDGMTMVARETRLAGEKAAAA